MEDFICNEHPNRNRNNKRQKTPEEIERLLLDGKLVKIRMGSSSYQYIESFALSWLVVEIHKPGFVEWMENHPYAKVVHHVDGNPLNNIYSNLKVMNWGDHGRMHTIEYNANPANAKAVETRGMKLSKSLIDYNADPKNAEAIKVRGKVRSKTKRRIWLDLSVLEKPFTVKEYADVGEISYSTAWCRLKMLLSECRVTCEKMSVAGCKCNVYRRIVQ